MPTLEKLPKLRILELGNRAFVGMVMICSANGFPRLEFLSISSHSFLEELRVNKGAMSNLRHLMIADCRNLKVLPDELSSITALKELKIEKMPKAFKDRLVEGGEDYYKVQHVPSIIFQNLLLLHSPRFVFRASIDSNLVLVVIGVTALSALSLACYNQFFRKTETSKKISCSSRSALPQQREGKGAVIQTANRQILDVGDLQMEIFAKEKDGLTEKVREVTVASESK
ncbi:hypothetical protein REPUB_Repub17cG0053400 [Reevesia pubescens]